MLTAAIFIPLAGAALVLGLRTLDERRLRAVATVISAVPLVLTVIAWVRFDTGTGVFQLVESARWIPSLGVTYKVGVDGLSLPLMALTALLFPVSIAYPADSKGRLREYLAWFLFLESMSLGLFLALDLFLFYVFLDLSLVGMYFLIGQWGHGEARRSALKFFIYTLAGTLLVLLGIFGLYLNMAPRTFDMAEIIRQQPLAGNAPILRFRITHDFGNGGAWHDDAATVNRHEQTVDFAYRSKVSGSIDSTMRMNA